MTKKVIQEVNAETVLVGGGKNRCYGEFKQTEAVLTNEKFPNSIIKVPKEHKNFFHPTQKSVALLEYLIKTYSNEGETILDNTMGSGSTGVAAKRLNRNFIGIELNEEYFKIAVKRIQQTTQQLLL